MAYRYQGDTNEGLVAALEEDRIFSSARIKRALLLLPRGNFVPEEYAEEVFQDRPLHLETPYNFNVSAPHMYAFCLQQLDLQPGQSFLDVGSGCGHMTAIGAYLCGPNGHSHGIDIIDPAIQLSRQSVNAMKNKGMELKNISFEKRNVFLPDPDGRLWDRIHVGAACPHREKHKLFELLKPGGVLLMPIGTSFVIAKKDMAGYTRETKLLDVRYGDLVLPTPEEIIESEKALAMRVVLPESSLVQDYVKMHNNSFLSDVVFNIEGRQLYGHRVILASRCEYFASLYRTGMRESNSNEIQVNGYSYAAFSELLRFIYTDNCSVSNPQIAAELMSAAEFYRIDRLKALMEHQLSRSLDIENACPILEIAYRFNAQQLKKVAFEYILKHFHEISKTSGFSEMHKECLTEILHVAVEKMKSPMNCN